MEQVNTLITKLGLDSFDNIQPLQDVCKKIKVSRPAYLVFALLVVSLAMIVIGLAEQVIVNVLGVLYPAFQSVKAIQSPGQDDDKQWLTYWIVFSATQIFDQTFGFALGFIPFYHLIKLIFYVCLFHPQVQGALKVYDVVIVPLFNKYGSVVDQELTKLQQKAQAKFNEVKPRIDIPGVQSPPSSF